MSSADVLTTLLRDRLAQAPDAEGLVFADERLTWADLERRASALGRALIAAGHQPGEHVAIMLPDCADYAVSLLAVALAGGVSVPVNTRFKETEFAHVLADSDSKIIVTAGPAAPGPGWTVASELLAATLPDLGGQDPGALSLPQAPLLKSIFWLSGDVPAGACRPERVAELAGLAAPGELRAREEQIRPDDLAMIMYTSGTTTRPKGAMITHRTMVAQARCVGQHCYGLTAGDRFWTPLPMFHTGGTMSMLACMATGASYFHTGASDAGRMLRLLESERITVAMPVFEPLWLPVLDHPGFPAADLSALRMVQTAGVPEKQRLMQERLPTAINLQSSGMTETASYFAFNRPDDPAEVRLSTGGYPMPTVQVRVVDTVTGQDCPPGQPGETLLRGIGCFTGYYRAPELTEQAFDADGWFHTGDIGVLDECGRYTFVGRLKDMLKVGGENVAAAEVEDFLSRHPAVRLAQVVAAPDRKYDEVPAAFVELNPDTTVGEQELIDFCLGKIATFKVPRYVRFVTEWPMSATKIRKARLREVIAAELKAKGIDEAPPVRVRHGADA